MRPKLFTLLLLVTAASACKATPLPTSTLVAAERTIGLTPPKERCGLGANDLLHVTLLGHPELSTPLAGTRIDLEGKLHLPLVGPLPIDGMTATEAEALVQTKFGKWVKEPDVTLSVAEFAARRIYIFGQVEEPGAFVMDRPLNGLQALALAGGFTQGADHANICILRTKDRFVEVHIFDAATPDAGGLAPLYPDDFIFVRRSGAGSFKEQVLPYIQGFLPILNSLVNLGLVANAIND